jgi:hypothetical protein
MNRTEYTIPVRLDAKTFRRFSWFDTLRLRKRWVRPTIFALILIAFAVVALLSRREQSGLVAAVLLVVGLGLPLVYFGTFLSSVNMQVARHRLDKPRRVYTVVLNADGVQVTNDQIAEAPVRLSWKEIQAAFRTKDCIYLYVNAARAFLLPDGQGSAPAEEMWDYLVKHMGDRCKEA